MQHAGTHLLIIAAITFSSAVILPQSNKIQAADESKAYVSDTDRFPGWKGALPRVKDGRMDTEPRPIRTARSDSLAQDPHALETAGICAATAAETISETIHDGSHSLPTSKGASPHAEGVASDVLQSTEERVNLADAGSNKAQPDTATVNGADTSPNTGSGPVPGNHTTNAAPQNGGGEVLKGTDASDRAEDGSETIDRAKDSSETGDRAESGMETSDGAVGDTDTSDGAVNSTDTSNGAVNGTDPSDGAEGGTDPSYGSESNTGTSEGGEIAAHVPDQPFTAPQAANIVPTVAWESLSSGIGSQLGKGGGFGMVHFLQYEGTNALLKRPVGECGASRAEHYSLLQEAFTASRLPKVPQLMNILATTIDPATGNAALVLEYAEGGTLRYLIDFDEFTFWDRQLILHDAAVGLQHMHAAGFIHLDVKPENIFTTIRDGVRRGVLGDYGLTNGLNSRGIKKLGAAFGSDGYIPPDLDVERRPNATTACDVYSLSMSGIISLMCTDDSPQFCLWDIREWISKQWMNATEEWQNEQVDSKVEECAVQWPSAFVHPEAKQLAATVIRTYIQGVLPMSDRCMLSNILALPTSPS